MPEARGYRGFPTLITDTNSLSGQAKGMYSTVDNNLAAVNFAGDPGDLYFLSGTSWNVVSGSAYALSTQDYWQFQKFSNDVIVVGKGADPQVWQVGSSTAFSSLSSTAPQAAHVGIVRDFVVLGDIFDSIDGQVPNRVHWSSIASPRGDWTPTLATLAGRQDLAGDGGWVQAISGGEYGIIFQENSIWRMTFVGPPLIFQFDEIEQKLGTPAPRSIIKYRNDVYFLAQDGFDITTGAGPSTPIGRNRVDNFFFKDAQPDKLRFVLATIDSANQLIFWAYISNNAPTANIFDKIIIYDIVNDKWGSATIPLTFLGPVRSTGLDMDVGMQALFATVEEIPVSLDDPRWASGLIYLSGFGPDNTNGAFSGPQLDAEIVTGSRQVIEGRRSLIQNIRPLIDSQTTTTITCNVASRRALTQDPEFQAVDTPVDDEGDCPILEAGRYFRFKANITGNFANAFGIEVDQFGEDGDH